MLVLKVLVSVFIFADCYCSSVRRSVRDGSQPNIIFMLIDDLGWNDVGFNNNNAIKTPVLDNLVKEGVKLDNYYVQPICTPSRSTLMTGRSLTHTGLQHLVIWPCQASGAPLEMPTVADKLKEAGYATHMVGKWHLGFAQDAQTPTRRGFDSFYGFYNGAEDYHKYGGCYYNRADMTTTFETPAPGFAQGMCGLDLRDNENRVNPRSFNNTYSTFVYTRKAIDIIEQHDNTKPLFLYLAWQAVHFPLDVPQSYVEPYAGITDDFRRVRAGMTTALDEAIGKVMQALSDNGYSDNTIVIISTDNGGETNTGGNNWPLRGMKISNWEGGVRGVGIVHSTDHKLLPRNNYVSNKLIHISDWYPTLVNLAGGSTEGLDLDGYDVWEAISTGESSPRTELLHNIDPLWPLSGERRPNSPFDNRVQAAIRVGNWKLLTGDPYNGSWVAPWENPSLQSVLDPERQVGDQVKNIWLFDIKNDPNEQYDLSDQYPDKVDELLARLAFYNESAVTPNYPPDDPQCNPALRGGFWGPWLPDPAPPQ